MVSAVNDYVTGFFISSLFNDETKLSSEHSTQNTSGPTLTILIIQCCQYNSSGIFVEFSSASLLLLFPDLY